MLYIMEINTTKRCQKVAKEFYCEKCDYKCFKKSLFEKHLLTKKHNTTNTTKIQQKSFHKCECGKSYSHRASLYNHKKRCKYIYGEPQVECSSEPVIEHLLKENIEMKKESIEMKKLMIEMCKNMQASTTNMINSNNKNFNINIFLNEDCKDAINMSEFIQSIEITVDELEKIEMDGQTEGMSNILIQRLQDMDVLKRPVHCSDPKKQVIYIKDEDQWSMEASGKPKLKEAIDDITKKSLQKLPDINDENNPSKVVGLVGEILKDPREDKKIISKVAKSVCIP
jgi:hypothetical protein